jgi:cytochrome c-type biogenesis protein
MENLTIFTAFLAGLVSFLSPCVLPLVPGYISIISGFSLDQLREQDRSASLRRTVLLNSVMFIVGFSITFMALGASATSLGQFLRMRVISQLAGIVIIIFGLHLIGIFKINFLYRDKRFHNIQKPRGMFGALVLGLAFAFGWTPCIGPILAAILTMASTRDEVTQGVFMLGIYSAGLGVPFLMTSFGLNKFLAFYGRFKRHFRMVEVASGALVITVGFMVLTNTLSRMAGWFTFLNRFAL